MAENIKDIKSIGGYQVGLNDGNLIHLYLASNNGDMDEVEKFATDHGMKMMWGTDSSQFADFYNGDTWALYKDFDLLNGRQKYDAIQHAKYPDGPKVYDEILRKHIKKSGASFLESVSEQDLEKLITEFKEADIKEVERQAKVKQEKIDADIIRRQSESMKLNFRNGVDKNAAKQIVSNTNKVQLVFFETDKRGYSDDRIIIREFSGKKGIKNAVNCLNYVSATYAVCAEDELHRSYCDAYITSSCDPYSVIATQKAKSRYSYGYYVRNWESLTCLILPNDTLNLDDLAPYKTGQYSYKFADAKKLIDTVQTKSFNQYFDLINKDMIDKYQSRLKLKGLRYEAKRSLSWKSVIDDFVEEPDVSEDACICGHIVGFNDGNLLKLCLGNNEANIDEIRQYAVDHNMKMMWCTDDSSRFADSYNGDTWVLYKDFDLLSRKQKYDAIRNAEYPDGSKVFDGILQEYVKEKGYVFSDDMMKFETEQDLIKLTEDLKIKEAEALKLKQERIDADLVRRQSETMKLKYQDNVDTVKADQIISDTKNNDSGVQLLLCETSGKSKYFDNNLIIREFNGENCLKNALNCMYATTSKFIIDSEKDAYWRDHRSHEFYSPYEIEFEEVKRSGPSYNSDRENWYEGYKTFYTVGSKSIYALILPKDTINIKSEPNSDNPYLYECNWQKIKNIVDKASTKSLNAYFDFINSDIMNKHKSIPQIDEDASWQDVVKNFVEESVEKQNDKKIIKSKKKKANVDQVIAEGDDIDSSSATDVDKNLVD